MSRKLEIQSRLFAQIPGLEYFEHFISPEEELELIHRVDAGDWLGDLKRRVQHYGYKYDYRSRSIDLQMRIGELPDWAEVLVKRLQAFKVFDLPPDQLIVNEYFPGQGIAAHVDCEPCFTDTIASISLGSDVVMDFSKGGEKHPILLRRRSLVAMKGESRYLWKHSIAGRKTDLVDGKRLPRMRRISLTFRKVILA